MLRQARRGHGAQPGLPAALQLHGQREQLWGILESMVCIHVKPDTEAACVQRGAVSTPMLGRVGTCSDRACKMTAAEVQGRMCKGPGQLARAELHRGLRIDPDLLQTLLQFTFEDHMHVHRANPTCAGDAAYSMLMLNCAVTCAPDLTRSHLQLTGKAACAAGLGQHAHAELHHCSCT